MENKLTTEQKKILEEYNKRRANLFDKYSAQVHMEEDCRPETVNEIFEVLIDSDAIFAKRLIRLTADTQNAFNNAGNNGSKKGN